jgi:hypothetical protein
VAADFSLARSAFGRTLAMTGVAIVFGASCWLLLMATLIVFMSSQLGLPWAASTLIGTLLSGGVAAWAYGAPAHYFDHTRMQATRRQLARLGIGEMADFVPDADSPASARDALREPPAAPRRRHAGGQERSGGQPAMSRAEGQLRTPDRQGAPGRGRAGAARARGRRRPSPVRRRVARGLDTAAHHFGRTGDRFLVGRAEPMSKVSGPRLLQMINTLSGLFASFKVTGAAKHAEAAAEEVAVAAHGAAAAPAVETPPEAATPVAQGPTERVRASRPAYRRMERRAAAGRGRDRSVRTLAWRAGRACVFSSSMP